MQLRDKCLLKTWVKEWKIREKVRKGQGEERNGMVTRKVPIVTEDFNR